MFLNFFAESIHPEINLQYSIILYNTDLFFNLIIRGIQGTNLLASYTIRETKTTPAV